MLCIAFHLLADSQINKNKLLFFWGFFGCLRVSVLCNNQNEVMDTFM